IGIPYRADKSMEIVKQLFDLGILFEHITDLSEILKTYEGYAKIEADFRKTKPDIDKFLSDSIEAAVLISQLDFRGGIENDNTKEIRSGIRRINTHTIGKYTFLNAKEDASKIGCLASLLKDKRLDMDIDKIRKDRADIEKIRNMNLPDRFAILNKLKPISPESFYLWVVALYGGGNAGHRPG
ncbi:MAG: hypothetical protein WBE28_12160, partial [bacterium]